jgi:hypothetical protein
MNNILNDISGNIPKSNVISKKHIGFNLESEPDLKHMLNDTSKELEDLKKKYEELNDKYNKYAYLETIIADNGVVDKKYYIQNNSLISENDKVWKESTDLYCSWCCHPFETVPIGLPERYCQKTDTYYTRECFCSFNCAHAYNLSLNDYKVWERFSLLNRIKNLIYKNDELINKAISYAPPRQLLKVFGGDKTIEEFRNHALLVPKEYINVLPSMMPSITVIEEVPKYFQQNKLNGNKYTIQRTKPLPTKQNNLMNLFNKRVIM